MSNELSVFFPSSTHPALPIASNVLSTLRNLTGPGRGNDLKPEERAALVGVSALIACEKVQSKDLVEKTAQKAASVSPAHFRSALGKARRLLNALSASEVSSPSSSRSSRSRNATASSSAILTAPPSAGDAPSANLPSPFSTPKKKFKYSSGVDLRGLMHTPTKGSPLKQSVTPRRDGAGVDEGPLGGDMNDDDDGDDDEEVEAAINGTPTKSRNAQTLPSTRKKTRDDVDAFFALRPGSGATTTPSKEGEGRFRGFAHDPLSGHARVRRTEAERKERRVRRKRDWTFAEEVWKGDKIKKRNERALRRVREALAGL